MVAEARADIEAQCTHQFIDNTRPLHLAAQAGHAKVVSVIIEAARGWSESAMKGKASSSL